MVKVKVIQEVSKRVMTKNKVKEELKEEFHQAKKTLKDNLIFYTCFWHCLDEFIPSNYSNQGLDSKS